MPVERSARLPARLPAERTDDVLGSVIGGRYRVTSLIGRGGMASVYRALDDALPREVAVKLMLPGSADPDEMSRQRNEIDTLASLNHHALVTLFDAGTEATVAGERAFLVMELVDGPNLREVLAQPLAPEQAAHIGADVAEALHYMHGRGIVHRDIKPANILLSRSDLPDRRFHAKLADFGIARLVDATRLTSTGVIIGTANYLSPEQARGGDVGPAADVYALGLVLLETLTGTTAFPGAAVESVSARLTREPVVPDTLGQGWGELLTGMMALDPQRRPRPMDVALAARELAGTRGAVVEVPTVAVSTVAGPAETEPQPTRVFRAGAETATYEPTRAIDAMQATATTEILHGVPAQPTVPARSGVPSRPGQSGYRRVVALACAAVIVLAALAGTLAWTSAAPLAPAASSTPYPAVPGTLGTHLKQLQRSVTP